MTGDDVLDRAEIERVMLNFGRALDSGDWPLYRSCFPDRFQVNFERQGTKWLMLSYANLEIV